MDPLSIVAAASSCTKVLQEFFAFIRNVQTVDSIISAILDEVDILATILGSIETALRNPRVAQNNSCSWHRHGDDVLGYLEDCTQTLMHLKALVTGAKCKNPGILGRSASYLNLSAISDDVKRCRTRLSNLRGAMQLAFSMMIVYNNLLYH